jgi:hypothetical protein
VRNRVQDFGALADDAENKPLLNIINEDGKLALKGKANPTYFRNLLITNFFVVSLYKIRKSSNFN